METSASFEARSAPLPYPTVGDPDRGDSVTFFICPDKMGLAACAKSILITCRRSRRHEAPMHSASDLEEDRRTLERLRALDSAYNNAVFKRSAKK
jgi:hypothetical protein